LSFVVTSQSRWCPLATATCRAVSSSALPAPIPRGSANNAATSKPPSFVSWTDARPTGLPSASATNPSMANGSSSSPSRATMCVPPWCEATSLRAQS
jgi:hypothetical protein